MCCKHYNYALLCHAIYIYKYLDDSKFVVEVCVSPINFDRLANAVPACVCCNIPSPKERCAGRAAALLAKAVHWCIRCALHEAWWPLSGLDNVVCASICLLRQAIYIVCIYCI